MFMSEIFLSFGMVLSVFFKKTHQLQYNLETAEKILILPTESSTSVKPASAVINIFNKWRHFLYLFLL